MKAALILAVTAALALGQSSSTIAISNGVELDISASLGEPTGQQTIRVEMSKASGNSFYRIFRDQGDLAVFAYELVVNRNEEGTEFALTAKPVETEFASRFPQADGGKPVPTLSSDRSFASLGSGANAEIGLFELAGLGLKVVDTVHVAITPDGATDDIPLGSAQIRMRFKGVQVSLNRMPAGEAEPGSSVSGRYLMFYLPGHGAYFLSVAQPGNIGFLKSGHVDDNRLEFTWNNEIYECVSEAPILDGVRSGEVWVYNDSSYAPNGNWTSPLQSSLSQPGASAGATEGFFAAASDSLNWWFP